MDFPVILFHPLPFGGVKTTQIPTNPLGVCNVTIF